MIFQSEINECGLACLAMISGYYGCHQEVGGLRFRFGQKSLVSVDALAKMARLLRFGTRALKLEPEELAGLQLPSIVHWDMDHFVVLKSRQRKSLVIHDPAVGVRKISLREFSQHFTGIAVELTPQKSFKKERVQASLPFTGLVSFSPRIYSRLGQILCLSILLQGLSLLAPLYLQLVIDQGIGRGDLDIVLLLGILFVALTLVRALLSFMRGLLTLECTNQIGFQMARDSFRHLLRLPLKFFEQREVGDIVSRFSSLEKIREVITSDLITVTVDGLFSLLTLVLLFLYSPTLAAVALLSIILFTTVRLITLDRETQLRREALITEAGQQSRLIENIRRVGVIQVNEMEAEREADWLDKYGRSLTASYSLTVFQLGFSTSQSIVFGLENIAIVYLGANAVFSGSLTLGQLMSFLFLKQHLITSVSALLPKFGEIRMLRLELDRVAEILLEKPRDDSYRQELRLPVYEGDLNLIGFRFCFPGTSEPLFSDLNLSVPKGGLTVVTGDSGCGKTTLLRLLIGLESGHSGKLLVGSSPCRGANLLQYRESISVVLHGDGLLAGDLAFNINLGVDPGNRDRLNSACEKAGLLDLVAALPLGFATRIGELGSILSAGQIKRVLLARALYRQPALLILDETLAQLGVEAKLSFLESVRADGITMLVVSHDSELIDHADQVVDLMSAAGNGNPP